MGGCGTKEEFMPVMAEPLRAEECIELSPEELTLSAGTVSWQEMAKVRLQEVFSIIVKRVMDFFNNTDVATVVVRSFNEALVSLTWECEQQIEELKNLTSLALTRVQGKVTEEITNFISDLAREVRGALQELEDELVDAITVQRENGVSYTRDFAKELLKEYFRNYMFPSVLAGVALIDQLQVRGTH